MKNVVNNAFISNFENQQLYLERLKALPSLRTLIAQHFDSDNFITLGNNTSACFLNLILALENDAKRIYVYSNIEHPCFQEILEHFIPKERLIKLSLHRFLCDGQYDKIEDNLKQSRQESKNTVYLISHVIWNTGVILNIDEISRELKTREDVLVIGDGSQAIGNIPLTKINFIDFYLGCTHKWLGTSHTLGFLMINNDKIKIKRDLSFKDKFSIFAGYQNYIENAYSGSTYDLSLALQLVTELNEVKIIHKIENSNLKEILSVINKEIVQSINYQFGRFVGVLMTQSKAEEILKKLSLDKAFLLYDKNLKEDYVWLRIGV